MAAVVMQLLSLYALEFEETAALVVAVVVAAKVQEYEEEEK